MSEDQAKDEACGVRPAYQPSAPGCYLPAGHDGEHRNVAGLVYADEAPWPRKSIDPPNDSLGGMLALIVNEYGARRVHARLLDLIGPAYCPPDLLAAARCVASDEAESRARRLTAELESATHERDEAVDQLAALRADRGAVMTRCQITHTGPPCIGPCEYADQVSEDGPSASVLCGVEYDGGGFNAVCELPEDHPSLRHQGPVTW